MAKEGRKLELYEILAAKRDKGKVPLGLDQKTARQANSPDPVEEITDSPGLIIDDAVGGEIGFSPPKDVPEQPQQPLPKTNPVAGEAVSEPAPTMWETDVRKKKRERPPPPPPEYAEPAPEPRPKSPREVVFALDTALFFFFVVLVLAGTSFFIGYKRGLEERPTGLAGIAEIDTMDGDNLNIRNLSPPPQASVRPSELDYALIIRTEPASDDLPERLELELAEALVRGRQKAGYDFPGFIFRTSGNDPLYILAVGLADSINNKALDDLRIVYNEMEGIALSRIPTPYKGCRIAPIRDLGTPVY